ncbi:unnamed protein product [Urochloa humidicola]
MDGVARITVDAGVELGELQDRQKQKLSGVMHRVLLVLLGGIAIAIAIAETTEGLELGSLLSRVVS